MYDDDGKLVYLYRVIDGLCTRSHAFSAALAVGLPDVIIRRANEVRLWRIEDPNILRCLLAVGENRTQSSPASREKLCRYGRVRLLIHLRISHLCDLVWLIWWKRPYKWMSTTTNRLHISSSTFSILSINIDLMFDDLIQHDSAVSIMQNIARWQIFSCFRLGNKTSRSGRIVPPANAVTLRGAVAR